VCGIVGFAGHAIGETELQRAVRTLHHRGPDGNGIFLDDASRVGLGHTRLSIIDLETGAQPLYSEGKDLVLVCNGEIYDFERIRTDLEARGHVFSTRTDSEVILHLYEEYGLDFVDHLRGEFAFLLYDQPQQILLAVRDRFGVKPLFFNVTNANYLFASEAKGIFATGQVEPKIHVKAIRDYLSGVTPDSIFQGVHAVPPGCFLKVSIEERKHELCQYWDLNLPPNPVSENNHNVEKDIRTVRESFEESVRLRLRTDVPLGVYLSGGLDSAVVAAAVARHQRGRLKVFSIAFPDNPIFDEQERARHMAEKIGAEFHSVTCDRRTLLNNTVDSLWASECPFYNFHGVGKFVLSRLARQHVKVVLTGEGSDEVFLGYSYFQPGKSMPGRKEMKAPKGRKIRRIIETLGFLPIYEFARSLSNAHQTYVQWLFHPRHRPELRSNHPLESLRQRIQRRQIDGLPLVRKIQHFSIKAILTPYILVNLGDRPEMAHSLEGRPPFLDHHLFEKARQIPDESKIRNGSEKYVLREAYKDDVTEDVYQRTKWPYFAPALWLRKGNSAEEDKLLQQYLSREAIEKSGIFHYGVLRWTRWFARLLPNNSDLKYHLHAFFVFVLTVQILDHLFVQGFEASLKERQP